MFFLCNDGFDKKVALIVYILFQFCDITDFGEKMKEICPKMFLYGTNQCRSYYFLCIITGPENLSHGHTPSRM